MALHGPIDAISKDFPLELVPELPASDSGHILGLALTDDGELLAAFSTTGIACLWSTASFRRLQTLRDSSERYIDEFFTGCFSRCQSRIAVAGKLKDPDRWSTEDDDNHILPSPIKVFDVITGELVCRLDGHQEEILSLCAVVFKGHNFFLSTSQDGSIRRWEMNSTWDKLVKVDKMVDKLTCMAFDVAFLPQTDNRLFVAACDNCLRIFDMESITMIAQFDTEFSCYCDCIRLFQPSDTQAYPQPSVTWATALCNVEWKHGDTNNTADRKPKSQGKRDGSYFTYIVARGVETVEVVDDIPINTQQNKIILYKLTYPSSSSPSFRLEPLQRYGKDTEYMSNSWLTRIATNGRYVVAPTYDGSVYIFDLTSGSVAGILRDHDSVEVRDVRFHPTRPFLFTCGDDGAIKVYKSRNSSS